MTRRAFADYGASERWTADACVIGGGAGGAATACALAEQGLSVVVLEQGSHWHPRQFQQDAAWAYRNIYVEQGARSAVGNGLIPVPGGRGVGGSTLINSAIAFRTPLPVMREWHEHHGCERITPERFGPKLDRVWDTLRVVVNPVVFQRNNNLVFKRGADALGLPGQWLARSAPGCVGCGVCYLGCPTGGKFSVDRTFLVEALQTGRCEVHADCRVDAVDTEGDKVVAVRGRFIDPTSLVPGGGFEVRARVFVVAAGAVATPQLLLRNGLADGTTAGAWLFLHPATGMLARFPWEIRPWRGVTQGYFVDRWERGYLLQTYTASPDQTYVGMPFSLGDQLVEIIRDLRYMAMAGPLVHDEDSRGGVTAQGMTYFLGDGDRRKLLAGMRECSEVFFAAGATEVYPGIVGAAPIRSVAGIDAAIPDDVAARQIYLYASHPMGTCRMGADPATSCADPDGRVWGWGNLYLADTSLFPTSLGVNPQVTTMAMGLTVGEAIGERG
ncbi:MAG: FAD-dependent oxidoreductase [Alphaproteobacteria bacterium]|nr:FAD-dependent oxidoreductase [Alphaproteobacteria bacterium]